MKDKDKPTSSLVVDPLGRKDQLIDPDYYDEFEIAKEECPEAFTDFDTLPPHKPVNKPKPEWRIRHRYSYESSPLTVSKYLKFKQAQEAFDRIVRKSPHGEEYWIENINTGDVYSKYRSSRGSWCYSVSVITVDEEGSIFKSYHQVPFKKLNQDIK